MTTLFISDLHLDADSPQIAEQFIALLESEARDADALYILGDLFESWIGDDDPNEHYAAIRQALRKLVDQDVPVYFMHGNRDFMIGEDFASETGVKILPDPYVVEIHGTSVLLSHGDAYCTDDFEYQEVRKMTRNPQWQAMMLTKPVSERLAFAARAREASMAHGGAISEDITDVNGDAVEQALREADVSVMLHGHTHRPKVHSLTVDGRDCTRIVLGDWFERGSVVRWDADGPELSPIQRREWQV